MRTGCPLHGLTSRRSASVWNLYSRFWTTLIKLSTPQLIPLWTRELLTSSHCRLRGKWRKMTWPARSHTLKDQDSANVVKSQLKDLSIKLQTNSPVRFVSRKIGLSLQELETKPQLVNQQCVVYQFKCNLCDTRSYVGYTRGHLHARLDGHKSTSSSVRKSFDIDHAVAVP